MATSDPRDSVRRLDVSLVGNRETPVGSFSFFFSLEKNTDSTNLFIFLCLVKYLNSTTDR